VSYIHMYTPVSEGVIRVLVRSNYGSTGNKLYPTQFFHICTGTPYWRTYQLPPVAPFGGKMLSLD